MSNIDPRFAGTQHKAPVTLAEVRSQIAASDSLSKTRRRDLVSALNALAKVLGRPPEAIPADPVHLRDGLAHLTAAMAGLKRGRWRNIQSLVSVALAEVGIVVVPGRFREKPSPEWQTILGLLCSGIGGNFHLWRFARYCTVFGIPPNSIDDAALARYEDDLTHRSLVSEPKRVARETVRAWNAAATAHAGWPQCQLTLPDNRRIFAPAWDVYPVSLLQQIEAWFDRLSDRRLFNGRPGKPVRPTTITNYRRQLRCYIGALVLEGVDPKDLVDLAAVVTPERAKIALNHFWEKAGQQQTTYIYQIAGMVLAIARYAAKLPAADIDSLKAMMKDVKPAFGGMTERNISRLRQFDDPDKLVTLINLPLTLVAQAKRLGVPSIQSARDVQTAVMIEILIHVPIRIGNLRGLRLGIQVRRDGKGAIRLVMPAKEVKNEVALDFPLPSAASELVCFYIDRYRPLLAPEGSDHLFPGTPRAGKDPNGPKSGHGLRTQIQRAIAEHVGAEFHPHGFRHLTAYLTLREDPSAYGTVQRLLGHKSLHSTMASYSGLETDAAIRHHDALIERVRSGPKDPTPRKGKPTSSWQGTSEE